MATDEHTIKSLERISEAIKVLKEEHRALANHIGQQKRQPAWYTNEDGKPVYKPGEKEK